MPLVILTNEQIQSIMSYNKKKITELESIQKDIKKSIQHCWEGADPMSNSVDSITAFSCLNRLKDQQRSIKKHIKVLAELQYALKHTCDFI